MALLRLFVLGVLRLVLALLLLYWLIFIGYTIAKYLQGGPQWVLAWYEHISTGDLFQPWNWKIFVMRQIFALTLTLLLSYFEWWQAQRSHLGHAIQGPLSGSRG
jgi:hypothetical protein